MNLGKWTNSNSQTKRAPAVRSKKNIDPFVVREESTKQGLSTLYYSLSLDGCFLISLRGHRREEERLSLHGAPRESDLAERWSEGYSAHEVRPI